MDNLIEYKCPSCGGALEFDSASQKMKCPFCLGSYEMDELKALDDAAGEIKEENMSWDTANKDEWSASEASHMRAYVCKSCGGEIIVDETTVASSCPYCENPVVMKESISGALRPQLVLPFRLDKKTAKDEFKKHLSGKKLLPKVFNSENHIEEIKGIYVPFWLLDADASAQARFVATKTRSWSDNNYNYVETSYFNVFRAGNIGFDKIPVDCSTKMPDDLMESIEPFDYSFAQDFQSAYLAGYMADKYDVDAEESVERANTRVRESVKTALTGTIYGFSSISLEQASVQLQNGRAIYALCPVWILNTKWKDKKYVFAMNGQTGKFVGDLPMDNGAYKKYLTLISAGTAALVLGAAYLFYLL